ncbi:uncharacterized protein LOC129349513 [Amphiprion ocellaris]|uniref:uncharacterized protein LOC129349513 n=1 Tax=Amphiprion ocellaris TaxID=80972 RepID=UPI0024111496|nr:uncharacterized protein LOC129349513 [Amphiprion ocellaris]
MSARLNKILESIVDLDEEQSESVVRSSERCPSAGRPSESVSTVNSRETCEKVSKQTVHEESESDDRSSYQEPATELVSAPEPATSQVRKESHSSLYLSPEEKDVVGALLLKAMAKFLCKSKGLVTSEELQLILKQLLILLDERYLSPDFITKITQEMDKISKAMAKDLERMFGSAEKLLEAATTAKDESFKDAVWMVLQVNLEAIPRPDNLRSRVSRFFLAVRRYQFSKAAKTQFDKMSACLYRFCESIVDLEDEQNEYVVRRSEESESDNRSSHQEPATELVSAPEPATSQVRKESHSSLYLSPEEKDVVSALLLKAMVKFLCKSRALVTTEELQLILKQLLILLDERYLSPDFITKITQETDEISKAMAKDLERMFGSAEKLLEAAMTAKDESFKEAVWMVLQVNLEAIPRPDNLRSRVSRFFVAVRRNYRRLKRSWVGVNIIAITIFILFFISTFRL